MIQLFSLRQNPLPKGHGIWLAIRKDGKHTGIVFRVDSASKAQFLHLGFHHDLRCEVVDENEKFLKNYALLSFFGFDSDEQLQLALWMESIWRVNGASVPYGISYSGAGYFDRQTGKFIESVTGIGLTCATFVMAAFQDFQFPIVEWGTWPSRSSDIEFQQFVVDELMSLVREGQAKQEHVDRQIAVLGKAVRFLPSEVVVSGGAYSGDPVVFLTAELLAQHLEADLRGLVF